MQSTNPIRRNRLWVYLISSAFFVSASVSEDDPIVLAGLWCADYSKSIEPKSYKDNFGRIVNGILPGIGKHRRGAYAVTKPAPAVYGLAQCYDHVTGVHCQHCFFRAKAILSVCLPYWSGRIYLNGCYFRYDGYNFFAESVDIKVQLLDCSTTHVDNSSLSSFRQMIEHLVDKVTQQAWSGNGFGSGSDKDRNVSIHAMAQCWKSLSPKGCKQCLSEAANMISTCPPAIESRAMLAGCFLRYSNKDFLHAPKLSPNREKPINNESYTRLCITTVFLVLTFIIVVSISGCFVYTRLLAMKRGGTVNSSPVNYTDMNFNYEILDKATDHFNESNKLGQGGAGSVFKGVLPDGKTVAVKKVFFNTRKQQWADEFFNEVNLIRGIQHKNLVGLLGCSIEGPDSLLVYEYVPNRSLDQILFTKNTIHILSWKQRFEIISGTAEGLAFLHGGSGIKIIHRDIKTSNILLDQNLTPKIADFGLARSVDPSKSHLSTGVAGTLGYLAPEYLVRGQLTEKADVYAFGVLVIEIVSGRKNSVFSGSDSVLHKVWKHYRSKRLQDSVDSRLSGRFPSKEASNVLQIGLLCTQSSTELRPSMAQVVKMLKDQDPLIPLPQQPPFLNASFLSLDDTAITDVECVAAAPSATVGSSSSDPPEHEQKRY